MNNIITLKVGKRELIQYTFEKLFEIYTLRLKRKKHLYKYWISVSCFFAESLVSSSKITKYSMIWQIKDYIVGNGSQVSYCWKSYKYGNQEDRMTLRGGLKLKILTKAPDLMDFINRYYM